MSHPTADIFRHACICSSCKSFNKEQFRNICGYCNKYICKGCNVHYKMTRRSDDQRLLCCGECLEDKVDEIVAEAKSRKNRVSRDLQEYIEDNFEKILAN